MAYSVARRRGEIGIRMALGARGSDVLALVVRQGMRPAVVGLVVGSIAALACARFMAGLVYGVHPTDGVSLAIAVIVLGAVALVATALAARRVTAADPASALRAD
jgi:ABC-type antimicrobial peptide transport system permease subunit